MSFACVFFILLLLPQLRLGFYLKLNKSNRIKTIYEKKRSDIVSPEVSLLSNIDNDSIKLQESITSWLNNEFIDQECHYGIGARVADLYGELRRSGIVDVSEILLNMGSGLECSDVLFEKSFVGPWDVANKVSDILFGMLDIEKCSCDVESKRQPSPVELVLVDQSLALKAASIEAKSLARLIEQLSTSIFYRYVFLKKFLDGNMCHHGYPSY